MHWYHPYILTQAIKNRRARVVVRHARGEATIGVGLFGCAKRNAAVAMGTVLFLELKMRMSRLTTPGHPLQAAANPVSLTGRHLRRNKTPIKFFVESWRAKFGAIFFFRGRLTLTLRRTQTRDWEGESNRSSPPGGIRPSPCGPSSVSTTKITLTVNVVAFINLDNTQQMERAAS